MCAQPRRTGRQRSLRHPRLMRDGTTGRLEGAEARQLRCLVRHAVVMRLLLLLGGKSKILNDVGDLRRRQLSSERLHRTVEPDSWATGGNHRGQIRVRDSSHIGAAVEPWVIPEEARAAIDWPRCVALPTFALEDSGAAAGLTHRKLRHGRGVFWAPVRNGRAAGQLVGRRSADTGER